MEGQNRTGSTNITSVAIGKMKETEVAMITVLYCLLIVTIITGNGLILTSFCINRKLRTVTNTLIINLSVSDTLVGTGVDTLLDLHFPERVHWTPFHWCRLSVLHHLWYLHRKRLHSAAHVHQYWEMLCDCQAVSSQSVVNASFLRHDCYSMGLCCHYCELATRAVPALEGSLHGSYDDHVFLYPFHHHSGRLRNHLRVCSIRVNAQARTSPRAEESVQQRDKVISNSGYDHRPVCNRMVTPVCCQRHGNVLPAKSSLSLMDGSFTQVCQVLSLQPQCD